MADKACSSSSWATCSFKWWRSAYRCMLGSFVPIWWNEWQNPSCDWGRCLSTTCWPPLVSSILLLPLNLDFQLTPCSLELIFYFLIYISVIHPQLCSFQRFVLWAILSREMIFRLRYELVKDDRSMCFLFDFATSLTPEHYDSEHAKKIGKPNARLKFSKWFFAHLLKKEAIIRNIMRVSLCVSFHD